MVSTGDGWFDAYEINGLRVDVKEMARFEATLANFASYTILLA